MRSIVDILLCQVLDSFLIIMADEKNDCFCQDDQALLLERDAATPWMTPIWRYCSLA